MNCRKCEDFDKKYGCQSIMKEYCNGKTYFMPATKNTFWDWVGVFFSAVIICSAIGLVVTSCM